ncbi:MAG: DUF4126 family protein [Acidobacteriaceae bacterium]
MKEALAFAVGMLTGLRTFTGPAWVSLAAERGRIDLEATPLKWMATSHAAKTFAVLAAGEYVADKLPFTPARVGAGPLGGRLVFGALSGAAVELAAEQKWYAGAALGAVGALVGAFAGYGYRRVIADKQLPDLPFALIEDAVNLSAAYLLMRGTGQASGTMSSADTERFSAQEARYAAID